MTEKCQPNNETLPFFSIIMPLYNKKNYVRRAVESILVQSFRNFELIIADDGSTDGSADEIKINDPRIKIVRQKNRGPSVARNKGIQAARGEFITFLDADDIYDRTKLEKNRQLLLNHNDIDWLLSACNLKIDEKLLYRGIKNIRGNIIKQQLVVNNALFEINLSGIHINGLCIRKEVISHILNGFNENLHCFEITEFLIRCALVRPRVILDARPLHTIFDIPNSAYKSLINRTSGAQHMSQLFKLLSSDIRYTHKMYNDMGMRAGFAHVIGLIEQEKRNQAIKYLLNIYPYKKNFKWLKLLIRCLVVELSIKLKL